MKLLFENENIVVTDTETSTGLIIRHKRYEMQIEVASNEVEIAVTSSSKNCNRRVGLNRTHTTAFLEIGMS